MKTEVGRREDEIESLKEAVEAEEAKIARLERLIKQYSTSMESSGVGNAGSTPFAKAGGKSVTTRPSTTSVRSSSTGLKADHGARVESEVPSSNRSTASSYISADSSAATGSSSRLGASRAGPAATATASDSSSSRRPVARPTSSGLTTKTATPAAVSEGLQHLRLHRTTAGRVNTVQRVELKSDSEDDLKVDDENVAFDKSLDYDLSDEEEPLPTPAWMKLAKY